MVLGQWLGLAGQILERTPAGVILTDSYGTILATNRAFTSITGYSSAEVLGANPKLLQSGRHGPEFYEAMWTSLASEGHWEGRIWNRRKSGELYPEYLSISRLKAGEEHYYAAVFSDVSTVTLDNQKLVYLASHDALTGLSNRIAFADHLAQLCARFRRTGSSAAVIYLDLDGFKTINDTHGHIYGDRILSEIGKRLLSSVRAGVDTVARLGGDEFALLQDNPTSRDEVARVVSRTIELIGHPVEHRGVELRVGASAGISVLPDDGTEPNELLEKADVAMYSVKRGQKGDFAFFSDVHQGGRSP